MSTFKINGIDISNDVIVGSFNYTARTDEIFGQGALQFESTTITENIAPYSILQIDNNYYCCSSEATYHFGRKSWFHNVAVIESTSLLSRFLVGSKTFSITGTNKKDYEKINILLKLINDKYKVNIYLTQDITNLANKEIEYVFTAGTTLFDALNEICKNHNLRMNVNYANGQNIAITFIKLDEVSSIATNNLRQLSITKIQNAENYCKYLETEATNVIDTNQLTIANNLYLKASDVKLSEDTFKIETPTNIFKLDKFEIVSLYQNAMKVQIQFNDNIWLSQTGATTEKTFNMWVQQYPFLEKFFTNVFSKYYIDKNWFYSQIWVGQQHILYPKNTSDTYNGDLLNARLTIDLTTHILSKEQYDLVEDKDKPDYAYYTSGSNIIDGFTTTYNNDFWNTILGQNNIPFIYKISNIEDTSGLNFSVSNDAYISVFKVYTIANVDPFKAVYRASYYPISNPYLVNTKSELPQNETDYKPYALSFNKSSNYVDFDKLNNSMQIENKSVGKVELVVEYESDNDTIETFGTINIDNKNWYVESCEITYNATQTLLRYNLVSNYNKIADIISLNSQYNTLKNPLDNIIERPLLTQINANFEATNGNIWFALRFYDKDNSIIGDDEETYNLIPATIYSHNNETYLYCTTKDNYSINRNAREISNKLYKLSDVQYVDANNEFYKVKIDLFEIEGFDYSSSLKLPVHKFASNETYTALIDTIETIVYKDAREKITFTIKANNCIIK